jgi:internalin A
MKLSLVAIAIFILTSGFYNPKVTAAPTKTPKTFTEWCEQKASLSSETELITQCHCVSVAWR